MTRGHHHRSVIGATPIDAAGYVTPVFPAGSLGPGRTVHPVLAEQQPAGADAAVGWAEPGVTTVTAVAAQHGVAAITAVAAPSYR